MKGDEEQTGRLVRGEEKEPTVSDRQWYAILLLQEGASDAEVADLVGIRVAQLRAWKEHPRFRRAKAQRVAHESLLQGVVAEFRRRLRRYPEPETPWTSEREEMTDE